MFTIKQDVSPEELEKIKDVDVEDPSGKAEDSKNDAKKGEEKEAEGEAEDDNEDEFKI
jgi:hypothetical protein